MSKLSRSYKQISMENKLSPSQKILLFISIALTTFLIVLDSSIANVALPYIAGGLAVSTDQGTYVITTFAVGSSIGLAMTGFLTKRIGEVRLIVASISLFILFSTLCGLSINFPMIVCARFAQGLVSGPLIPLSQSLLVKYGTAASRARDLSIWASIVVVAPVIGPILGGYISDRYSWPWIFYINIPMGLFCAFTFWSILRKRESTTEKMPIDVIGIALLIVAVSTLQIFLDKGEQWDWWNSPAICIFASLSAMGFTYLIIREAWHKTPLLNLQLFKYPSFSLSIVCLTISYTMYFGSVVLVPLWLQEYMGYNAEWAGLAVCTIGIPPILFSLLTPWFMRTTGNTGTLMISFLFFALGCFYSTSFTRQIDFYHVALARFIFGFGFVCYIAPLLSMNIQEISADKVASAAGIFHFVRSIVGAIGASLFTTIWKRRIVFHHSRIGETLTLYNPMTPSISDHSSLSTLEREVDIQSALLGINDTFYLMGLLFIFLIGLLLIWKLFGPKKKNVDLQVFVHTD